MFLLLNCIIYNFILLVTLLCLIKKNPRYMMQDYPEEITMALEEKTKKERKESIIFGLPFILTLILYPLLFGLYLKFFVDYSFLHILLSMFVLVLSFNIIDLLIVDWLIFCTITPDFIILSGTKGNPGYKDYRFHFIAFIKGTIFSAFISLLFSGIIEGLHFIFN